MNYALRGALHALTTHVKCSSDGIEKNIIGFGLFASVASATVGAFTGAGPLATTAITTTEVTIALKFVKIFLIMFCSL